MRKIIITGSEGLIGKQICSHFEALGDQVIKCDISLGHDLTDEVFVKNWFKDNKADYLVNLFAMNDHIDKNRGHTDLFSVSLDSFRRYMDVNLTALFSVCREYARNNEEGAILNFSSLYGIVSPTPEIYNNGEEKHIGYSVSKAGTIQLTKHLAAHLAPNIRVNCIAPGGIKHKQDAEFIEAYSNRTPMKRMMNVEEMCSIVDFMSSKGSSYINGATYVIDGGWSTW